MQRGRARVGAMPRPPRHGRCPGRPRRAGKLHPFPCWASLQPLANPAPGPETGAVLRQPRPRAVTHRQLGMRLASHEAFPNVSRFARSLGINTRSEIAQFFWISESVTIPLRRSNLDIYNLSLTHDISMNTSLLNRFTLIQQFSPSGCKKGLRKKKYSQITNRPTKDKYLPLSPGDTCRHWCGSTFPRPPRTGSASICRCLCSSEPLRRAGGSEWSRYRAWGLPRAAGPRSGPLIPGRSHH